MIIDLKSTKTALAINEKVLTPHLTERETPEFFDGFGKVEDIDNSESVAYFFAQYAQENINKNDPYSNLQITVSDPSSGGMGLINDLLERSGDDGYLSKRELQAWADEIGYTGDIAEIMEALENCDEWLFGENALDIQEVPVFELSDSISCADTDKEEYQASAEEEINNDNTEEQNNSKISKVTDLIKGSFSGIIGFVAGLFE